MRDVACVAPFRDVRLVGPRCHYNEPSTRIERGVQPLELSARYARVLGRFRAHDKIIRPRQWFARRREERIVDLHTEAPFFEHYGERRAGAGTVIETVRGRLNAVEQGRFGAAEESTVMLIRRVVLVRIVAGALRASIRVTVRRNEDESASRTR